MSAHVERALDLLQVAENAGAGSALAGNASAAALARATLELAEQQRIANKVACAHVAQLGEVARLLAGAGHPTDPAIPFILTPDEGRTVGL